MTYYNLENINKKEATYNIIIGERSNGKTYSVLEQTLKNYFKDGSQMAYVRRWQEDITGRRASMLFTSINEDGLIAKYSDGEFTGIFYYAGKYYLCNYDGNGKAIYGDNDIIAYCFSISSGEHDKSTSFPRIKTIMFDEFITNKIYLPDEFVHFINVVSTIVRRRDDVKIYMLGNTVNKFCPYFNEMGLDNVDKMIQGSIDIYKYGESKLTVAVEYCETTNKDKKAEHNKYFAFNNPKLEMITGGSWELDIYPHLPVKYLPKDIMLKYYIKFNDLVYECKIIDVDGSVFTYIHNKTTDIKNENNHVIYSFESSTKVNYSRNILKPKMKINKKILWFFKNDLVFYQDNNIGDAINNYLKTCKRG